MNEKPKIFLIGGKARHGKDTFSNYLKEIYEKSGKKVIVTQLAKYIKYYAQEMTGWDLKEETKPREFLQHLGTDIIRQKLKKDTLFIDRMNEDIEIFSNFYDVIIVSDVKFKIEIDMIKEKYENAKSVHIVRPNFDNGLTEEQKKHKTEIDLDDYKKFDETIINTTLEELKENAEKIYTKYEKRV